MRACDSIFPLYLILYPHICIVKSDQAFSLFIFIVCVKCFTEQPNALNICCHITRILTALSFYIFSLQQLELHTNTRAVRSFFSSLLFYLKCRFNNQGYKESFPFNLDKSENAHRNHKGSQKNNNNNSNIYMYTRNIVQRVIVLHFVLLF